MLFTSKQISIVLLFVITVFFSYKLAISKTIELHDELSELTKQNELLENTPQQLSNLIRQKKALDSIVSKNSYYMKSAPNNLLALLNEYAKENNLSIESFDKPHIVNDNNKTIMSIQFSLIGSYNDIVKVIYNIEQKSEFGEVINVQFQKKKELKEGIEILCTDIIIQKGV